MGFKRAQWHSGLTYEQTCEKCNTTVRYKDDKLDFRPWYADGFIYCPKCKTPLRHNEKYAVDAPKADMVDYTENTPVSTKPTARFCSNCGSQFDADAKFCSNCGAKRN
ncbi:MAG: zinc ribbon domain-containing protein [Clostridia bacterium]|nr:zinc ribbon domain-containing protein [Clostridia bacterium]